MSTDYFSALLRSAGRPVDGAAPLQAPASTGADLVEIDAEREVQAPESRNPLAQPRQPSMPAHKTATPTERQAAEERRPVLPAAAQPARRDTQTALPEMPEVPDVPDLVPPPLHAAVQAALAWVASDPRGRGNADPAQVVVTESMAVETQAGINESDPETQQADALTRMQSNIDDRALPSSPALVHRAAPAPSTERRTRSAPAPIPTPAPRQEAIEITIGAIHLHIDAPVQAGIAPAPGPPPAAPSLRSPAPRSTLSRRALYRL
jgi:hypothetical protein